MHGRVYLAPVIDVQRKDSSNATITVIGVGGTGCALLPLIGTMSVSAIAVVDGDTVEEKNLARQLLFTIDDVGRAKVTAAVQRMGAMQRAVRWTAEHRFVDANNITALLQGSTVVADCTDDLVARALIDRTCRALHIPLVSGAVYAHQVQVITCVGTDHSRGQPGFFQGRSADEQLTCDMREVPAAVTTLTASLMSLRIANLLQGGDGLAGVMDLVDAQQGRWLRIMGPEAVEFMDTPINRTPHV